MGRNPPAGLISLSLVIVISNERLVDPVGCYILGLALFILFFSLCLYIEFKECFVFPPVAGSI